MSDTVFYVLSAVLSVAVLLGIHWMSKVETAVRGNRLSALAMLCAIILTFIKHDLLGIPDIWIGLAAGSLISVVIAKRTRMTDLDAMAAIRALPGQSDVLKELVGRIAKDGRQGMIPRDMIAGLPMPVAIMWGEKDQVLDPRHADGLTATIAVIRIADRGHMLPEECPDEVATLIRRAVAS